MSKLHVAIISGGPSAEHEVSRISAKAVLDAIDRDRFHSIPILVSKQGRWSKDIRRVKPDVVFPLIHGTYGEDGCIQGYLETLGLPYVGCGVMASAIGMDKIVQKQLFEHIGLPVVKYEWFTAHEWKKQPDDIVRRIITKLRFPFFTKSACLGSSIGIRRVGERRELTAGIREALRYDTKVIVEEAVPEPREIEVGVLGNESPRASVAGEIIPRNAFYDYDAKYVDGGSELIIPTHVSARISQSVRAMAIRAFSILNGRGMARVDFLLSKKTGKLYLNEINTIPGFTACSMYPKLWEASGVPFSTLITTLLELATKRI